MKFMKPGEQPVENRIMKTFAIILTGKPQQYTQAGYRNASFMLIAFSLLFRRSTGRECSSHHREAPVTDASQCQNYYREARDPCLCS